MARSLDLAKCWALAAACRALNKWPSLRRKCRVACPDYRAREDCRRPCRNCHRISPACRVQAGHAGVERPQPRDFLAERPVQRGLEEMGGDVGLDDCTHHVRERVRGAGHDALHVALKLLDVAPHKLAQERLLVGKILVERPDADTRALGDAVGAEGVVGSGHQEASGGFENGGI